MTIKYLTEDARSITRRDHIYARAGAPVTIIAEHGTVLIVEDERKVRFPVLRSIVSQDPISEPEITEPVIDVPIPSPTKAVKSETTRKSKSVPPAQQHLF